MRGFTKGKQSNYSDKMSPSLATQLRGLESENDFGKSIKRGGNYDTKYH